MTLYWLVLAGFGQPLAMEAYRWAPLLAPDDVVLARLHVREVTLAGPFLVLCALAIVPVKYETRACNEFRFLAPWATMGLLLLVLHGPGLERNAPYRIAYLAQQMLMAGSWWCAAVGERPRARLDHYARLSGFLFACLGVALCLTAQFVLGWDTMLGTVPIYDPWLDTPSQAGALGIHWATWALVAGSIISIPALRWLNGHWRGLQARLMGIGR